MTKVTVVTNTRVANVAMLALFCFTLMMPQSANADLIAGEVAFVGTFSAIGGTGPQDLAGATGIDFAYAFVAQANGDFNAANGVFPFFSPVTLADFTFAPSFVGPVNPLWTTGTFSFALQNLTSVSQGSSYLALAGTGVVSSTSAGLDPTVFNWSFSGDNSGGTFQLFSSTSSPTRVAESSGLSELVLFLGIAAFCLWSRERRNALQP